MTEGKGKNKERKKRAHEEIYSPATFKDDYQYDNIDLDDIDKVENLGKASAKNCGLMIHLLQLLL